MPFPLHEPFLLYSIALYCIPRICEVATLLALGVTAAALNAQSSKNHVDMVSLPPMIVTSEVTSPYQVRDLMKNLQDPKDLADRNRNDHSWLRFLYVTPERIAKSKRFMSSLEKIYAAKNVKLIVIDEVSSNQVLLSMDC